MSELHSNSASVASQSWLAIRSNVVPGFVLWAIAAAVVAAYYWLPVTRPLFDTVAGWKEAGGFGYSIVATAVFAGVIPFLALGGSWSTLVFFTLFWAWRGLEIDLLYRGQGLLFGNDPSVGTLAAKVAVDQFVYNVFWAAHLQLLAYFWKDSGFRWRAFGTYDWKRHFTEVFPVTIVATWVIWIPVVTLVYALPPPLQIPLFNLAACFWSFVMATLTQRAATPAKS
jgi:hypothetical protein